MEQAKRAGDGAALKDSGNDEDAERQMWLLRLDLAILRATGQQQSLKQARLIHSHTDFSLPAFEQKFVCDLSPLCLHHDQCTIHACASIFCEG